MNRATKRPAQIPKPIDKSSKRQKLSATAAGRQHYTDRSIQSSNAQSSTPTSPGQQSSSTRASDEFEARCILKERRRKGRKEYLIDWEGVDPQTGKAYLPSWEPEENVGDWHIRQWNRKRKAKRKRLDESYLPSQKLDTSSSSRARPGSSDACLDSIHATRPTPAAAAATNPHSKRRRQVVEDSSSDTDTISVIPSHGLSRTPALDSDIASASAPHSPSLEILESQHILPGSLPFTLELPSNHINSSEFETCHSSQHSFPSIPLASADVLSQVTDLHSLSKSSHSSEILRAANQRLLGSTSISTTPSMPQRSGRSNPPRNFSAEYIPSGTQRSELSQPRSLFSSPLVWEKLHTAQERQSPGGSQSQGRVALSSAQQPVQPSVPRHSVPRHVQSQLLSPIACYQDPQAAMDLPNTQQSTAPLGTTTSVSDSQPDKYTEKGVSLRAFSTQPVSDHPAAYERQQSAPPPSLSVADHSIATRYDDLSSFPSGQPHVPDSNSTVGPGVVAPTYDPSSSGSALPIQESIEEEIPSSSAEEASLASKASSSQASLENDRLIPQIDGISLPLQPVLGPAEYTISLPAEGKIQSAYTDTIKAKRKSILKFIHRRDSAGSTRGSTSRTRERNEMIELIERLHDTTTHFDLGLPGFFTQYTLPSQEHAEFAKYAGSKFVFLGCLIRALSSVDCTVIIAAKPGPVQQLIQEFLLMKQIPVTRHDRPHSARSKTPDFHQTTLKFDLIDTSLDTEIQLSSRPALVLAFDSSFDNQSPQIKQIRELYATGRNQLLPVVHLLTSNSSEHIDRCLRKSMPSSQRLKLLVRGSYQAHNHLGGSPTYMPDASDTPDGRPMDMNDLQRAVRKSSTRKLNMVAHIVARAAIAEDFEQHWSLGAMPEVQYDELDDTPPDFGERSAGATDSGISRSRKDHDQSRTPVSCADTPSGKKRLLDPDDVKFQALIFKRQRMSPQVDPTQSQQELARDVATELELREQIKTLRTELSSEREARSKIEANLEQEKKRSAHWEKAHNIVMQRYDLRRLKQHKIDHENKRLQKRIDSTKQENERLVETKKNLNEQIAKLKDELNTSREELKASAVPELAALEAARSEGREALAKVASLERQIQNKNQDFEFTRQQYQQASTRAAELGKENSEFESEISRLKSVATDERRKLRDINLEKASKQDLNRIEHLEQENKALERLIKRTREDLEMVKKTRGVQTRGSSVQPPGSPAGMGTRSRQSSPALGGGGAGAGRDSHGNVNHRVSGLRNERS